MCVLQKYEVGKRRGSVDESGEVIRADNEAVAASNVIYHVTVFAQKQALNQWFVV